MLRCVSLLVFAGLILSVAGEPLEGQRLANVVAQEPDAAVQEVIAAPKGIFKIPKDHQFTDTMPRVAKASDGNQWDPRKGVEVQSEQWIYIETAAKGTIPVKLYVVAFDMRKAGVPKETLENIPNPFRVQRIGFETTGIPTGESARTFTYDAPEITGKSGQPTFTIKRTPGAEPYTVFTETPVFP